MSTTTSSSKLSLYDLFEMVCNGENTPEMQERAKAEMAKIEAERVKQAEKRAEKAKENDPLKVKISDFLAKGKNWANAVGAEIGVTTSKASYLLRDMELEGYLTSEQDKAPGAKSKSKCYTLVKPFVATTTATATAEADTED